MRTRPLSTAALVLLIGACGDDTSAGDTGMGTDSSTIDTGSGTDSSTDSGGNDAGDSETPTDSGAPDTIAPARERTMWVSVGGEPRLAVVDLAADGSMSARAGMDLDLPGNPGAMTYARSRSRLYVGIGGDGGRVATVDLAASGRPSLAGTTSGTGFPVFLATANGDDTMITAYFGDNLLRSHDVTGAPPHAESDNLGTDEEPHQALVGPTGDRLYVPHRNGQTTDWFDIGADGELTRVDGLAAESGAGPRHIAFTPDGSFAYVINEYSDSVSAHTVAADGALTRFQTISTLPGGFDGDSNTCADVHVTPDGRFLYGSNRGHDSLAMFSIGSDGMLTSLGQISTEARPREFDVSPDGRFVVAAGQDSGFLQSYRVEADGTLTMVDRLRVGDDLRWVIID